MPIRFCVNCDDRIANSQNFVNECSSLKRRYANPCVDDEIFSRNRSACSNRNEKRFVLLCYVKSEIVMSFVPPFFNAVRR